MVEFTNHSNCHRNIFSIYSESGIGRRSYWFLTGIKSGVEHRIEISDEQRDNSTIIPKVLQAIAVCESEGRQFGKDGKVLRIPVQIKVVINGKIKVIDTFDTGKWQINEYYWLDEARRLGVDIYSLKGNTQMALYIYEKYGTRPWSWSVKCWTNY